MKDTVDTDQTLMIEAAKGIERLESQEEHEEEQHEESEGHQHDHAYDPHVWLDPTLAIQEVQTIATELGKKYPDKKDTFDQNAAAYIKKIRSIGSDLYRGIKRCNQSNVCDATCCLLLIYSKSLRPKTSSHLRSFTGSRADA